MMKELRSNITEINKNNETSLLFMDKDKDGKLSMSDQFFIKSKLFGKEKLKFVLKANWSDDPTYETFIEIK